MNWIRSVHGAIASVLILAATELPAAVIVRKPGGLVPLTDALVENLRRAPLDGPARIVDLSGDSAADAARLSRECEKAGLVFTVGPEAASAVAALNRSGTVVGLGVPNPAKIEGSATFVSVYPRLESVLDFTSGKLKAKRIGVLHSPSHNRETLTSFQRAATGRGVTIVPMAATSSGELVRAFGSLAGSVDAVVLTIDPLLFDRQSLRFVVEKASAAKKPTIGFLPELVSLGVTFVLTNEPAAVAATAVGAAKNSARPGKRVTAEVDGFTVLVSRRAAELIGIPPESLSAYQIR
jgi:ABC-type uncharacterized transport system substrate-binding protein